MGVLKKEEAGWTGVAACDNCYSQVKLLKDYAKPQPPCNSEATRPHCLSLYLSRSASNAGFPYLVKIILICVPPALTCIIHLQGIAYDLYLEKILKNSSLFKVP